MTEKFSPFFEDFQNNTRITDDSLLRIVWRNAAVGYIRIVWLELWILFFYFLVFLSQKKTVKCDLIWSKFNWNLCVSLSKIHKWNGLFRSNKFKTHIFTFKLDDPKTKTSRQINIKMVNNEKYSIYRYNSDSDATVINKSL